MHTVPIGPGLCVPHGNSLRVSACGDVSGFGEPITAVPTREAIERMPALCMGTMIGKGDALGATPGAMSGHKTSVLRGDLGGAHKEEALAEARASCKSQRVAT